MSERAGLLGYQSSPDMADKRVVSDSKRDALLRQACRQSVKLVILTLEDGRVAKHLSRFLRIDETDRGMHLAVAAPAHEGAPVVYRDGREVEGVFQMAGERYVLAAEVVSNGSPTPNREADPPALILACSQVTKTTQRRAHYRLYLDTTEACTVAFCEWPRLEGEALAPDDKHLCSGLILDLSAGGMAIHCMQRLPNGLGMGSKIRLWFQLPGGSEPFVMEASIRSERTALDNGLIFGVEFATRAKSVQERETIDAIRKFIVAGQHKLLKNSDTA